jgi:hypothetical protein
MVPDVQNIFVFRVIQGAPAGSAAITRTSRIEFLAEADASRVSQVSSAGWATAAPQDNAIAASEICAIRRIRLLVMDNAPTAAARRHFHKVGMDSREDKSLPRRGGFFA